jgi:hypothetical protein
MHADASNMIRFSGMVWYGMVYNSKHVVDRNYHYTIPADSAHPSR